MRVLVSPRVAPESLKLCLLKKKKKKILFSFSDNHYSVFLTHSSHDLINCWLFLIYFCFSYYILHSGFIYLFYNSFFQIFTVFNHSYPELFEHSYNYYLKSLLGTLLIYITLGSSQVLSCSLFRNASLCHLILLNYVSISMYLVGWLHF